MSTTQLGLDNQKEFFSRTLKMKKQQTVQTEPSDQEGRQRHDHEEHHGLSVDGCTGCVTAEGHAECAPSTTATVDRPESCAARTAGHSRRLPG